MKTIRDLDITGKRLLLRVDFNVPMDEQGNITDDIRIRRALPTIEHALSQGAKLIICSHMGRPKGQRIAKYSLNPIATHLQNILSKPVTLAPDCIGEEVETLTNTMANGDIVLLENLRFHAEETAGDTDFAAQLGKLADTYINDAFAVSHRAHASVVGVTKHCNECGAGFLLEKEMDYFHRSMNSPARPLVAIVGGAKVSSKLGALENMLDMVDCMLIGGAMANTFLKSQGVEVGASKIEDDLLETARNFLNKAKEKKIAIHLPLDVTVADSFSPDAATQLLSVNKIPEGWMALDIGSQTIELFKKVINDAKTIVWNGPMGAFEMEAFANGTMTLAHAVAASEALSITGGGDSNAAVTQSGVANDISYMSTGGGAFLTLMEGKELPGVVALR
ncbi:MAG: phosphoglycerate kinase [Desulfobulbaceae bacterium]|nr:phosphoglycerate kinase [Desulfobulbaceae bacterium]